jgi:hypothetical protein
MDTGKRARAIVVRMEGPAAPDLGMIDALARLQVAARRTGWTIRLRVACPEVRGLIELVGLADALALEPLGQTEDGEQLGVEEVVEPGDPIA